MATMIQEFERMLRQFGNWKYDADTDTYRSKRKNAKVFSGDEIRKAANLAERDPDNWASYFDIAMNGDEARARRHPDLPPLLTE